MTKSNVEVIVGALLTISTSKFEHKRMSMALERLLLGACSLILPDYF